METESLSDISHLNVYKTLFSPFDANDFTKINLNYHDFSFRDSFFENLKENSDYYVMACFQLYFILKPLKGITSLVRPD